VAEDWAAVARAIDARLAELNWRQRELAERAQVSVAIVRELHRNTTQRRRNARTLEWKRCRSRWAGTPNTSTPSCAVTPRPIAASPWPRRWTPVTARLTSIDRRLAAIERRLDDLAARDG
jgi:hypothetical protein